LRNLNTAWKVSVMICVLEWSSISQLILTAKKWRVSFYALKCGWHVAAVYRWGSSKALDSCGSCAIVVMRKTSIADTLSQPVSCSHEQSMVSGCIHVSLLLNTNRQLYVVCMWLYGI